MATNNEQIERIAMQIQIYEYALKEEPESKQLKKLLEDTKKLLNQISK